MTESLSRSSSKVQEALNKYGFELRVLEMKQSTRTARDAAEAVGCQVGQIAKSLVFKGKQTGSPVLVIASGANQVNEKRMREYTGEPVVKPDADYVLEHTGYAIGGIPPVGHSQFLNSYIDEDLLQYKEIWAAAGTPFTVFQLTPEQLITITCGKVVCLK